MANYIGFVLTNAGRNLLARAVANETKINFTKLEIGSGYNSGDDKLLTQLVNKKNEYRLNTLKKNNNQVDLTFVITNRKDDGSSAIDTAYKISNRYFEDFENKLFIFQNQILVGYLGFDYHSYYFAYDTNYLLNQKLIAKFEMPFSFETFAQESCFVDFEECLPEGIDRKILISLGISS